MNLFKAMGLSASGLNAQRMVIDAISMNLANIQTTRTDGGGPYRRKQVLLSFDPLDRRFSEIFSSRIERMGDLWRTHPNHFSRMDTSSRAIGSERGGVKTETIEDPGGYQMVYDPSHPDSNEEGYVYFPNINLIEEMVTLLRAVRSYEANVTAFNAAKAMALKALEIGR